MKPFRKPALALGALVLTAAASGVAVRAADPVTITKLVFAPITRWAARRTLVGRNRSRHEPQRGPLHAYRCRSPDRAGMGNLRSTSAYAAAAANPWQPLKRSAGLFDGWAVSRAAGGWNRACLCR